MQVAADHCLRFFPLGHLHGRHVPLRSEIGIETDKVDEVRSLEQQLRHDRVVVVVRREVAIGTRLGFGLALGMRIVRRERLARIAAG